jgi:hypothetical protein
MMNLTRSRSRLVAGLVTAAALLAPTAVSTVATAAPGAVRAAGDVSYESAALRTSGYWILQRDGKVYAFGSAAKFADSPSRNAPAIKLAPGASGAQGYYVLYEDGAVDAKGAVSLFTASRPQGSNRDAVGQLRAGEKAAAISVSPTGRGYWIFTDRGRVFTFGDAPFQGDIAQLGLTLNGPILDSVAYPDGSGYYMVASDGGVFAFPTGAGAPNTFYGSMGGRPLNQPVQSLVPYPDSNGYWLVASDGGIFSFAKPGTPDQFRGAMPPGSALSGLQPGQTLQQPVVGMVSSVGGYIMVARDGGAFVFPIGGSTQFFGSVYSQTGGAATAAVTAIGALTQDDGTGTGTGGTPIAPLPVTTTTTATPGQPTTTTSTIPPVAYAPNSIVSFGVGTFTVGTNSALREMPPGYYRQRTAPAAGPSGARCTIYRVTAADSPFGIIPSVSHGPIILRIDATDREVIIGPGCPPLTNDLTALGTRAGDYDPDFDGSTSTNWNSGYFFTRSAVRGALMDGSQPLNGVDVAPGTFTATAASAARCYWTRKTDFRALEFDAPSGDDNGKNNIPWGPFVPVDQATEPVRPASQQVKTFTSNSGTAFEDMGFVIDFRNPLDPNPQGVPEGEIGFCRYLRS